MAKTQALTALGVVQTGQTGGADRQAHTHTGPAATLTAKHAGQQRAGQRIVAVGRRQEQRADADLEAQRQKTQAVRRV